VAVHKTRAIFFGGVADEDVSEERLVSTFFNELYVALHEQLHTLTGSGHAHNCRMCSRFPWRPSAVCSSRPRARGGTH